MQLRQRRRQRLLQRRKHNLKQGMLISQRNQRRKRNLMFLETQLHQLMLKLKIHLLSLL
jgi:hypothetical protein